MKKQLEFINCVTEIKATWSRKVPLRDQPQVTNSAMAHEYLAMVFDELDYDEKFYIVHLSRANRIIGHSHISTGGLSGTVVDPKKIFQNALKANAAGLILAHNHPSGQLQPSEADKNLTKKMVAAGKFLEIAILDHLILSTEGYFSFADHGMIHD
jgi:DNA repair protein RadC